MRKKELKLVVTFHTTADAMAMEKACREQDAPGHIRGLRSGVVRAAFRTGTSGRCYERIRD